MFRLSLDHITAVDAGPLRLVELAHDAGCEGICLFMEPMEVLPLMPQFDLYSDAAARRQLRQRMAELEVVLDLAYPFTLAGRTELEQFKPALECAAELEARLLNVLVYDRDPARRQDNFTAFCELASSFGLRTAIEFYPVSQIRSLTEAIELVQAVNRPGEVGVNADLLHLMRSGGSFEELAAAPEGMILYGQYADGPETRADSELDFEASSDRLLAGAGAFDLTAFAKALPKGCPVSVEIPRNAAAAAGVPVETRVRQAVDSVRHALAES